MLEQVRRAGQVDGTDHGVVVYDRPIEGNMSVESTSDPDDGDDPAEERPDPLETYPDRWYVPDSDEYPYAVRTPDGDRRYFKTRNGAVRLLERRYG